MPADPEGVEYPRGRSGKAILRDVCAINKGLTDREMAPNGVPGWASSITLLSLRPKPLEMRVRTTWTTPASGQAQITLIEPVSLTFMHLGPTELNKVILGACRR